MRAVVRLEKFATYGRFAGYMGRDKSNPWVARLLGLDDQYGFKREFIRGYADYTLASGTGARGIYVHYALDDGVYEINARQSWKQVRRYFLLVREGEKVEISREDVLACITNDTSESVF